MYTMYRICYQLHSNSQVSLSSDSFFPSLIPSYILLDHPCDFTSIFLTIGNFDSPTIDQIPLSLSCQWLDPVFFFDWTDKYNIIFLMSRRADKLNCRLGSRTVATQFPDQNVYNCQLCIKVTKVKYTWA